MARVCDVCRSDQYVAPVAVEATIFSHEEDDTPDTSEHLTEFDACATCRGAVGEGGLPELMQRYGAAHKLLKRTRKPT